MVKVAPNGAKLLSSTHPFVCLRVSFRPHPILSTYHSSYGPLCLHIHMYHFVYAPFFPRAIVSTCHSVHMPFCLRAILSYAFLRSTHHLNASQSRSSLFLAFLLLNNPIIQYNDVISFLRSFFLRFGSRCRQ